MPEGKPFEYNPGESEEARIEARSETIAEFESLAARLTLRASPSESRGEQMAEYEFRGKKVWVAYTRESRLEGAPPADGAEEEKVVGYVTVMEPLDKNRSRERTYKSLKDGSMHTSFEIYDKEEDEKRAAEMRRIIESGDEERIKQAQGEGLDELMDLLNAPDEEDEMGVGKVTEAELRELNMMLKTIIDEKERKEKKESGNG